MKQSKTMQGIGGSIAAALAASILSSVLTTIVLTAIFALLMNTEKMTEKSIGYAGMGILMAASLIGASVAERKLGGNRLMAGLGAGGIYFLVLICVTALFFDGSYHGVCANALMILCGSGIAIIFGKSPYKTGKGRGASKRSGKIVQKKYMGK